jgi:hypothetical protein
MFLYHYHDYQQGANLDIRKFVTPALVHEVPCTPQMHLPKDILNNKSPM